VKTEVHLGDDNHSAVARFVVFVVLCVCFCCCAVVVRYSFKLLIHVGHHSYWFFCPNLSQWPISV